MEVGGKMVVEEVEGGDKVVGNRKKRATWRRRMLSRWGGEVRKGVGWYLRTNIPRAQLLWVVAWRERRRRRKRGVGKWVVVCCCWWKGRRGEGGGILHANRG